MTQDLLKVVDTVKMYFYSVNFLTKLSIEMQLQ